MNLKKRFSRAGYSLIEVMAAATVVAVGISGAVSLASSMKLQEEMSWRVSIAQNYQENVGRLWQLGISATDVMRDLMPLPAGNPQLSQVIEDPALTNVTLVQAGQVNTGSMGTMETAALSFKLRGSDLPGGVNSATSTLNLYRPVLK